MTTWLHERPTRRPASRHPWSLQPVSRIVGQRPLEFIRRKAWTSALARFSNGISAVTALCLVDEPSAGGPPLLIAGDEDGGVSVQRVSTAGRDRGADTPLWSAAPELRRARLHSSGVNAIKVLPDRRGFVCAGDDGVVNAVATLEAASESDIRRATFALTGHSGYVTDCDTASSGPAVLSSSTDGRMLLWDPVAANTPVASVSVGRPVNSACFSAGDPYALVCAPELSGTVGGRSAVGRGENGSGAGNDDLIQIWDLRSLKCFREAIPAAVATAFGERDSGSEPPPASMQPPPPPPSPQAAVSSVWSRSSSPCGGRTTRSAAARTPAQARAGLRTSLGSTLAASPETPLQWRSAWADSSDNESVPTGGRGSSGRNSLWSCLTPDSDGKENDRSGNTSPSSRTTSTRRSGEWARTPGSSVRVRCATLYPSSDSCDTVSRGRGSSELSRAAAAGREGPAAVLGMASLADNGGGGCLHKGDGQSWVPGGSTWQPSERRARAVAARRRELGYEDCLPSASSPPACATCTMGSTGAGVGRPASVYSVQVSSDGRGILVASRDATVTLWDAQSREIVYRFGHSRLSLRARPILAEASSSSGGGGWGSVDGEGGINRGNVFTGMKNGEIRAWRVGSKFPNRVFKAARRHEGFEVTCLASSWDGGMFASADSSGKVCVQSATRGGVAERDLPIA